MKPLLVLLTLFWAALTATAQSWTNRYNGPANGSDRATTVVVDGSGNVYVTGFWRGPDNTTTGSAIIKYSNAGVAQWTNRYENLEFSPMPINKRASLAVDGSGNVFVSGTATSGDYDLDWATIKYSGAGVPLWTNRHSEPMGFWASSQEDSTAIALDRQGNVFVTGTGQRFDQADYITIKYSNQGVPLWTNVYNGGGIFPPGLGDMALALALDGQDNVIVTGGSARPGIYEFDYLTIKYSNAGMPLWTNRYDRPGGGDDYATAVAVDGSDNIVVTGSAGTLKYSPTGALLWLRQGPIDYSGVMVVDGAGNVFLTGSRWGSQSSNDWMTVKYSGAGVPLWTNRYDRSEDYPGAVAVDGNGDIYVTGNSWNGSSYDGATIKYSGSGVPLWTNDFSANDFSGYPWAIAVDNSSNAFVAGSDGNDYVTIKYSSVPPTDPHLLQSPQAQTVLAGDTLSLLIVPGGTAPFTFQWFKETTVLDGATNAALAYSNAIPSLSGLYSVVVSNALGSITSAPVVLAVVPLLITTQPQSQDVRAGTNATLSVSADSNFPVTYQWRLNDTPVEGATGADLLLSNVGVAHEGDYTVVASNSHGSVTSQVARLTVLVVPVIIQAPLSQSVVVGGSVTFSVQITGHPQPFTYQWRRGSTILTNMVSQDRVAFFTVTNVQANQGGTHRVLVANPASTNLSTSSPNASWTLTVLGDTDGDGLPDTWEALHSLDTNAPSAAEDTDGDRQTDGEEYLAGTNPRDPSSCLKIERIEKNGSATIEFLAVSNKTYSMLYADDLATGSWFKLADSLARLTNHLEKVMDPATAPGRFYRLVTPRRD